MERHLVAAWLWIAIVIASAGCGPSETPAPKPPAPQAAAPAPAPAPPHQQADPLARLAAEVYIYAYPLVLMDLTRQVESASVGSNTFIHRRSLPDASTQVPAPNADFLYSEAWLDLSEGPVYLSAPDTRNRYYLIAMLDAWTNVAGSLGTRTTGSDKIEFAIVGPHWKGTLPGGVSEVRSPTDMAWLLGRTEVRGPSDLAAANKVQEQYKLVTHAQRGKRPGKGEAAPKAANVDTRTDPRDQVAHMDAVAFFSRFATLLPANPPPKEDAPMLDKVAKLGVVPGQRLDPAKLDAAAQKSLDDGMKTAQAAIVKGAQSIGDADIRNGWMFDRDVGRWGVDYGKRAVAAYRGVGVNAPEDAMFLTAKFDGTGHKLDGSKRYVLHFDANKTPPTEGFWSVSVYDAQMHFVANPLHRFNRGSDDKLRKNADGSIDIMLQAADPGGEAATNWIPTPKAGPYIVMLRIYWPKYEVIASKWVPPGIRPVT